MDTASDKGFLDFAGTAGVNDEVRRKEESAIREIVDTIKRTNEKIELADQTSSELSKSEKHANNEARELLQAANDLRNGVTVDCGIAKTLVQNVISSSLSGNDISEEARKKGKKGISEAAMERLAVHRKHSNERTRRMTDFRSNGTQKTTEFHKHKKAALDAKKGIEQKHRISDLEHKATAQAKKTEEGKSIKANLVKEKEKLQNQVKQKNAESSETKKAIAMQTAEHNKVKNAHATMVAVLTKGGSVLVEKKEVLHQEIYHAENTLAKLNRDLFTLNDQIANALTTLHERSKLEDEAKSIRSAQNDLAAAKQDLEMEILAAEKKLQGLNGKRKEIASLEQTLAELILKTNKLDEVHPSSRFDEVKKEIEDAQVALKELQRGPDSVEQLEAEHKKQCEEKSQAAKITAANLETERTQNHKLVESLDNSDPSLTKAQVVLKEIQAQVDTKGKRVATLEKKAFNNREHQRLVRKYKVLKAARKLHDQESSYIAKIAKLKRE